VKREDWTSTSARLRRRVSRREGRKWGGRQGESQDGGRVPGARHHGEGNGGQPPPPRLPRHRLEPDRRQGTLLLFDPNPSHPVPLRSMLSRTRESCRRYALMRPPVSVRSARSSSRWAPPSGRRPPPSSQSATTPSPCSPTPPPRYQLTYDFSLSLSLTLF
jgi:hypothetical protein